MDTSAIVENVTYVYKQDIRNMSKQALLNALKQTVAYKKELVTGLEDIESSYVIKELENLDVAIEKIKALLDAE